MKNNNHEKHKNKVRILVLLQLTNFHYDWNGVDGMAKKPQQDSSSGQVWRKG